MYVLSFLEVRADVMIIERTFNNKVRMDKQNKFKLRSVSIA